MLLWTSSDVNIVSNSFFRNNATSSGGGIFAEISPNMLLTNNAMESNTAIQGGAIGILQGSGSAVSSNAFFDNAAVTGNIRVNHKQ